MVRIISALILAVSAFCAFAEEPLQLVDNPPDRHIVVRGDTLWDISGKFLKKPWRWPEIWNMNKAQIKNPHWIYPGDVIMLYYVNGKPRLRIGKSISRGGNSRLEPKIYSEAVQQVVPSIPSNLIEPFISRPLVIEPGADENDPRIVAAQEDRMLMGAGDTAFASGIPDASVVKWNVFRKGKPLKDPDTGEVLGNEAYFLGDATLIQPGEPAALRITLAKEEIGLGDRLQPAPPNDIIAYAPHRPDQEIAAKVMSIYGGVNEGGRNSVVSINRGSNDSLEVGHVLALFRNRVAVGYDDGRKVTTVIPEERYALAFVFRVFKRVSYALVVEAGKPVIIGDSARNP